MSETLMEIHGREKIEAPAGFVFFFFEKLPKTGSIQVIKMIGGVAPPIAKGLRKGEPNWRKMDPSTRREVYLPIEEHKAWVTAWEIKTGLCSRCQGKGETVVSWNIEHGQQWKKCSYCGGTGQSACMLVPGPGPD